MKKTTPLNRFILDRVNRYFRMIKSNIFKNYQLKDRIEEEKIKLQKAQSYFEDVHYRCVKYQNLHCLMVTIITNCLKEMRCVEQYKLDEFVKANEMVNG